MPLLFLLLAFYVYRWFLPPAPKHVLNVYFGVPGSGKTTFAAWLTRQMFRESWVIRFCKKYADNKLCARILASPLFKRKMPVYSNVPITGAYMLDAKTDIGHYMIQDAEIIIDEAGIEYNNRNYKAFPPEAIYFYKYHRHYKTSVDVFSQSYEDMDITLRRLAQNFYVVRKSLIPFCVVRRRIRRKIGVDENTHQIMDLYAMGLPIIDTKRIFSPVLWKMFNSYSHKKLPAKEWTAW
ncbi:zonular occludens toxin domain-containing protein [uncultured Oscillibacter sp.]|uniref:zonular occludens toxin domain-containing protein n=1 Tax=uncultured Oscillibacter sp. TaxID=876091 RepID=UPI0025F80EE0|nr:zonular occludens toxin domain-containing protein [uncultured Oscillibacter sp.]